MFPELQRSGIWALAKGVLAAVFCPYPLLVVVGLAISWRDTMPNAHSLGEALSQAASFAPGSLILGPVTVIFTAPAILAWALLRWKGWAPWYICLAVGALTGWVAYELVSDGSAENHPAVYMQAEMAIAGLITGLIVWGVSRTPDPDYRKQALT